MLYGDQECGAPNNQIIVTFNDAAAPLIFDLPDTDLDTAEDLTADMRDEVQQGDNVIAPVVAATAPDGSAVALEPARIVSIDPQEVQDTE